ncbi:DUF6325 family protein [Microbacterium sp.]|uniref:DUF6325 family protein n=1 Tax=Microbacterium sp. TaxID=51671 RepID=UPI003C70701E
MTDFRFGPVELYLISLDGDRPTPGIIAALSDSIATGVVRLLDFVIVSKDADGTVTAIDLDEEGEHFGFGDIEFAAIGITGQEDIDAFAELVAPGTSSAIVALELTWATRLASSLAASGAEVISTERIPAPVVNAIVDLAESEADAENEGD